MAFRIDSTANTSAGILMYHDSGGPYWPKRDLGAWSIPKGELDDGEDAETAARREFAVELGVQATGPLQSLGQVRQGSGKIVHGHALQDNLDIRSICSNDVSIESPPRSGRIVASSEIDRAAWFAIPLARGTILVSQRSFLDRLEDVCKTTSQAQGPEAAR